jgi:redox-sensing transcriptional repressor
MARSIKKIPASTVARLSIYLRAFSQLKRAVPRTLSSKELAEWTGINSAQVRKDLAYFGQFGRRGVGYSLMDLKAQITSILGLDREWNAGIVGVGHLGTALLMYKGYKARRFKVVAAFDTDPDKISWELEGVRIHDISSLGEEAREKRIDIAILCVGVESAQEVADAIVAAGIPAILNFAPVRLVVPKHVLVRDVDFGGELEALTYELRRQ